MQCKDIPDMPILRFIGGHDGQWCNWYFGDALDVHSAFPPSVPDKLLLAKMSGLIRRGLVGGCACGCRGDYVLTEKGLAAVQNETPLAGDSAVSSQKTGDEIDSADHTVSRYFGGFP